MYSIRATSAPREPIDHFLRDHFTNKPTAMEDSGCPSSRGFRVSPRVRGEGMTRIAEALVALRLPASYVDKLNNFIVLFHRWNRSINLSAARSEPEIHDHVIDSLHVIPHLQASAAQAAQAASRSRILDVGAGGGLPAVVAAICLPDTHVTALEPVHKKHAFLRTAARELSLTNLEALAERLERHPHHDYDAATSRATFDLREWLLRGVAHVRPGGLVLGFEAVPRSDLPQGTLRHPYRLDGKARAIVAFRVPR